MPAPLDPPALDALVDLAERPRTDGWSLRAALCRYAQPDPVRVSAFLTLVRRWEAAVHGHLADLRRNGPALHAAAFDDGATDGLDGALVDLLRVGADLDRAGDVAAAWAVDRQPPDPGAVLDEVTASVAADLDRLGVAEEQPPPRGARGRG
jgi:hypothetical protein